MHRPHPAKPRFPPDWYQLSKYSHLQSTVTCIDKAKVLGFPQDQQGTLFMTLERRPGCSRCGRREAEAVEGTRRCPSGTRFPRIRKHSLNPTFYYSSPLRQALRRQAAVPSISVFAWTH